MKKSLFGSLNGYDPEEMIDIPTAEGDVFDHIPKDKFLVGYVGSIGIANALEYLGSICAINKDA